MRKPFGKFLSLLLITALLVQLLPVSVFAREGGSPQILDPDVIGLADQDPSTLEDPLPPKILFEEEELREENVKHFRPDDGSYIAVQ